MQPKLDKTAKRDVDIEGVGLQLKSWQNQLDQLVVNYLSAGAHEHDPYRHRIDALRTRQSAVQAKFDEVEASPAARAGWGEFRAATAEDWAALQAGFKDLTLTPGGSPYPQSTTPRWVLFFGPSEAQRCRSRARKGSEERRERACGT